MIDLILPALPLVAMTSFVFTLLSVVFLLLSIVLGALQFFATVIPVAGSLLTSLTSSGTVLLGVLAETLQNNTTALVNATGLPT